MAPSLSQANRLFALVSIPQRRGYSVVRGALEGIVNRRSGMVVVARKVEDKTGSEGSSCAWAPDPVTGYYRPINHTNEIDPVELRNMLLNHTPKSSSSSSST